jgi:hypothetical protein
MTKNEALRLALEYVELVPDDRYNADHIDRDALITAIKAALEAKNEKPCPEFWDWLPKAYRHGDVGDEPRFTKYNMEVAFLAGKQSAALKAKDEPVAWRDAAIRLGEELSSVGPNGYYDMDAKEWLDWTMEQNPRGKHSLHKRTWVGLTDEEIAEALGDEIDSVYMTDFRRVEAKLKEKNNG